MTSSPTPARDERGTARGELEPCAQHNRPQRIQRGGGSVNDEHGGHTLPIWMSSNWGLGRDKRYGSDLSREAGCTQPERQRWSVSSTIGATDFVALKSQEAESQTGW